MADIATDRLWMRQHAERQSVKNEDRKRRADQAEHARQLARCPFCFHKAHHDHWGAATIDLDAGRIVYDCATADAWTLSLIVRACADPLCVCGVPPCPGCGDRVRFDYRPDSMTTSCPMCRQEEAISIIG